MSGWLSKKRLFAIHGWLGAVCGLPLFIICLAGAFAVLAPDIDRWIHPDMRIAHPRDPEKTAPLPWETLLKNVEAACPGGEVFLLNTAEDSGEAWTAAVGYGPRDSRVVFFDPYSGKVQSQRAPFGVQGFFRIFHKQFFILEGPFWPHGRLIVCVFSIVLLVSAATGLMFYKGWWKSLLKLRLGKGLRIFSSDLHRLVGVWTFLLAMLFAVTGLWYFMERVMEDLGLAEHEPTPSLSAEARSLRPPVLNRLPLDTLAATAREAMDGREITMVLLGNQPNGVTGFHFDGGLLASNSANRVFLDPYTGEIVERIKLEETGIGGWLESLVNPLHFGRFGGLLTKIIWTAAGFAISAGIFTGVWIYWMRARKSGTDPGKRGSRIALVVNLMILGLAGVSTVAFIRNLTAGPSQPATLQQLGNGTVGPWSVNAYRDIKEEDSVKFHFVGEGDPNFRNAFCWSGSGPKPDGLAPLKGSRTFLTGKTAPGTELQLAIENWDGTIQAASFTDSGNSELITPAAAEPVPWTVWAIVAGFFLMAGGPTVIWLVRLW